MIKVNYMKEPARKEHAGGRKGHVRFHATYALRRAQWAMQRDPRRWILGRTRVLAGVKIVVESR